MAANTISREVKNGRIEGICDPAFAHLLDEFTRNFEERGEVGASVAVTLEGEKVVDLWGGLANRDGTPWQEDTISIIFSCTKGALALCAHMLVERGLLDLDAPVADYWPEFAVNGKENATVSMMLDHSVGVPHIREKIKPGGYCDWQYMVDLVAREQAFWEPGTRNGYHGVTIAWTVGELIRRVAGKSFGQFFQDEVAKPLGLDFWVGLPEDKEPRVAPMIAPEFDPSAPLSRFTKAVISDPTSLPALFALNGGNAEFNSREVHAAEIGSANGMTNARGLAGMYAVLAMGGSHKGVSLVSPDTLSRMSRVAMATHDDATLLIPSRFALGFMKSMDNRRVPDTRDSSVIMSDAAFGHVGMGGSIGFADPEARMSFAYTMNRMGMGILLNERGQSVVDGAYRSLGYRSNASGVWLK